MDFKKFEMTFSAGNQDFTHDPDFSDAEKIGEFNGLDSDAGIGWVRNRNMIHRKIMLL